MSDDVNRWELHEDSSGALMVSNDGTRRRPEDHWTAWVDAADYDRVKAERDAQRDRAERAHRNYLDMVEMAAGLKAELDALREATVNVVRAASARDDVPDEVLALYHRLGPGALSEDSR